MPLISIFITAFWYKHIVPWSLQIAFRPSVCSVKRKIIIYDYWESLFVNQRSFETVHWLTNTGIMCLVWRQSWAFWGLRWEMAAEITYMYTAVLQAFVSRNSYNGYYTHWIVNLYRWINAEKATSNCIWSSSSASWTSSCHREPNDYTVQDTIWVTTVTFAILLCVYYFAPVCANNFATSGRKFCREHSTI